MEKIIGRKKEIEIFNECLKSENSEFIALYGRRRVGKTYLIDEFFSNKFFFKSTGTKNGDDKQKMNIFYNDLKKYNLIDSDSSFNNWYDLFDLLELSIKKYTLKKKVIFLDELAWMYNKNSSMIDALEHFYNSFAASRKDVFLIVASSSCSWINDKIIHNNGGLYNRISRTLEIKEFTLSECKEYVEKRNLSFSPLDILEAYMVFGGVPYYWKFIVPGESVSQAIDKIFLNENPIIKNEFEYLFASLFSTPTPYIKIITALATKKNGMTLKEIEESTKIPSNGNLSLLIKNLELSSFVRVFYKYKSKKERVIQLIDNFTIFHFKYLNNNKTTNFMWLNSLGTTKRNVFLGQSFELVCIKHLPQILKSLGINGILVDAYSYYKKGNENDEGFQIDLILDRADRIFNIIEIKYSENEYVLNKKESENIDRRINGFKRDINSSRAIFPILVTPIGLKKNLYSTKIVKVLTLEDLF